VAGASAGGILVAIATCAATAAISAATSQPARSRGVCDRQRAVSVRHSAALADDSIAADACRRESPATRAMRLAATIRSARSIALWFLA
jgi:hypothetical protein